MHPALSIIAQIARVEPGSLAPEVTLDRIGLNSSLGLGVLRSALERTLGRKIGRISWKTTVAQLLSEWDGSAPAVAAQVPDASRPVQLALGFRSRGATVYGPFAGRTRHRQGGPGELIGHGIDIQEVGALPPIEEPLPEGSFYRAHFTDSEWEGAKNRQEIRQHLCGLWCAKEAVKKASPELIVLDWKEIEVEHDGSGRPSLKFRRSGWDERYSVSLSISHSAAYAVASAIAFRR